MTTSLGVLLVEVPETVDWTGGVSLFVFFLIGLFGGAHCVGMCGPLVTMYSERMGRGATDGGHRSGGARTHGARRDTLTLHEVRQHSLFNIGRTVSYAAIGAVFGAAGAVVFVATGTLTAYADLLRGVLGVVVGGFIAVTGVYYLLGRTSLEARLPLGGVFRRVHSVLATRADRWVNSTGIVGLGALHGFLPCPMLYPAFLYAFAVGSPLEGFLSLAALGVGTVPAVFGYGVLLGSVSVKTRRRVHRLLGVVFIALSYLLIQHGLMQFGVHLPHPPIPFYQPLN